MPRPLALSRAAAAQVATAAAAAGRNEALGLLASQPGDDVVSIATVLDACASSAHAEASPAAVLDTARALAARGLVARGIWHSHGVHPVFHSSTDGETIARLLPAMAPALFQGRAPLATPCLCAPDVARVPLADGQWLSLELQATSLPGASDGELAAFSEVAFEYGEGTAAGARLTAGWLELSAGGVVMRARLPVGAALVARPAESAGARLARVYSLVVNVLGERHARCLTLLDADGETTTRVDDCDVVVVGADEPPERPHHGEPSSAAGAVPLEARFSEAGAE